MLEFASAGDVLPNDYTGLNHSFAAAAGGVISTANLRFMTVSRHMPVFVKSARAQIIAASI
jgi:hypothetical protein